MNNPVKEWFESLSIVLRKKFIHQFYNSHCNHYDGDLRRLYYRLVEKEEIDFETSRSIWGTKKDEFVKFLQAQDEYKEFTERLTSV